MPGTSLVGNDNLKLVTVREAAVLTTSFVASETFNIQGANQLNLLTDFTIGSSSGCQIKVEISYDDSAFHQITGSSLSGGTASLTVLVWEIDATSAPIIEIPVIGRFCKVSAKALTDGTSTSLSVKALKANI